MLAAFHDERAKWGMWKSPLWSPEHRLLQVGREVDGKRRVYREAEGRHAAGLDLEELSIRAGIQAAINEGKRR